MPLFEKLVPDAIMPTRATKGSGAYDLYSIEDVNLETFDYQTIIHKYKTGIKCNIPEGYCGQIWCRSSLGSKGVIVHGGFIDSDYDKEIMVMLSSLQEYVYIGKGTKPIAQMAIVPYYSEEDVLGSRVGGFGSTDGHLTSVEIKGFVDVVKARATMTLPRLGSELLELGTY